MPVRCATSMPGSTAFAAYGHPGSTRWVPNSRAVNVNDDLVILEERTSHDVWDACTNVERIPRWFLPITGDLVQGGRYQLEGNASGTIQTCTPPTGFSATWEYGGDVSWIEVRLSPESSERTRFELEHIAHVGDDIWAQFGPSAVGPPSSSHAR